MRDRIVSILLFLGMVWLESSLTRSSVVRYVMCCMPHLRPKYYY